MWHQRLGHVSFDTILKLNKDGFLSVTSILPKPVLCAPCQMAKGHKLPFDTNSKRANFPLDLIHCDLWGPSPVTSHDGYRYYALFIDDHSRFTWFYALRAKSEFHTILSIFIKFVQTQFTRKIKVFQSDEGTEFLNHHVRHILEENGTFHRISCPLHPSTKWSGRMQTPTHR